jgi:wyosine [tRNA(Phe)-imidazoG37] synthetase (radical SAM superfamily)
MTMPLQEHIVYGPVRSRRLGRSLGINLLPPLAKVCNLDCAYCQYGFTRGANRPRGGGTSWPTADAVRAALVERLSRAAQTDELIDRITVAGHGEPTLHPDFDDVTVSLREVRDRFAPRVPIAILSNSTTAMWEDVRRTLALYDERHMKLDAGDPLTYARINGIGVSVAAIVDALRRLPSIVVQSMFVADAAGEIDNARPEAVAPWLRALELVQPLAVHVYTLDRAPARQTLRAVSYRRLREIAEEVRAAGIKAVVFAGSRSTQHAIDTSAARRTVHRPQEKSARHV